MPKKLKLNLNDLKIQSFITTLNDDERKNLKGGSGDCDTPITGCSCITCTAPCTADTYCGTCGTRNNACC